MLGQTYAGGRIETAQKNHRWVMFGRDGHSSHWVPTRGGLWGKMMNAGRGPAAGILAVKGAISPEMAVLL